MLIVRWGYEYEYADLEMYPIEICSDVKKQRVAQTVMGGATADWGPSLHVHMLIRASQNSPAAYRIHDMYHTGTLYARYTLCSQG